MRNLLLIAIIATLPTIALAQESSKLDKPHSAWQAVPGTSPVWLNPGERLVSPPRTVATPQTRGHVYVIPAQPLNWHDPPIINWNAHNDNWPTQGISNRRWIQPYIAPNIQPWWKYLPGQNVDRGPYMPAPNCDRCRPYGDIARDPLGQVKTGDAPTLFDR